MAPLRELLAIFGTEFDDKGLKKGEHGITGLKGTITEFGKVLAGAFVIKEIVEFGREILEQADVLAKQSQALSVSTAELQGWQFAAQLSGSSAEEFNSAFTKFNKNIAEAAKGSGPAADALKALGVSIKDSTGKAGQPIELLDGVANGLIAMQDPAKRTATIMALFGKSGAKLLPLFLEGADGIAKLRAEVKELGAEFDESFLEDAQEVNDNIDRMKLGFRGLAIQAIKPLLPLITEWTKKSVEIIKGLVEVLKNSNALKAGLAAFGTYGAAKAISGFVAIAQKAGVLKNGLRGLLFELLPLVAAFLVLEDVWTFFTGGDSVTGDLIEKFFGKDAPGKVKEFAGVLKDAGIADFAMLMKEAFAIFMDGKPLDTKFKELLKFIDGPFRDQLKADFGAVGDDIAIWLELLTGVAGVLNQIKDAMVWIGSHTVNAVGKAAFNASDAAANEQAKLNAQAAAGKRPATAEDIQAHLDQGPLLARVFAKLVGFKAEDAVPIKQQLQAEGIARANLAPLPPNQSIAPVVKNNTVVNQYITAETPEDIKRKAAEGAKSGVGEGVNLRTMRALVPNPT